VPGGRADDGDVSDDDLDTRCGRSPDRPGPAASDPGRGLPWAAEAISAPGPHGEVLTIDHVTIGARRPARALAALSGVHGVEGYVGSALQCDLIDRLDERTLPDDVGIVVVHVVNPWGTAHDRRQNESNVDLNRNWARSRRQVTENAAYDEIHHLVCPDTDRRRAPGAAS